MIKIFQRPKIPIRTPLARGLGIPQIPTLVPHSLLAAVFNGTTSHITIDGLAADAYGQTKVATGYVMLVKASPPSSRWWVSFANTDDLGTYSTMLNTLSTKMQGVVVFEGSTKLNVTGPAQTQHVDGEWHLIHGADHYDDPNGKVYGQVDGATRSLLGTYARFVSPTPNNSMFSLGVLRYKSGPTFFGRKAMIIGYLARYDDEILDQAAWNRIFAAFDTGGGRYDTRVITEAIRGELVGAGSLKWAGALDGSLPHVNPDAVADPIYVDITFEPANYIAPKYAYMTTGAYMRASNADAATINAIIKSAAGPITVIGVYGADPELGSKTTYRELFGAANQIDTGGSLWLVTRQSVNGFYRFAAYDDSTNVLRLGDHSETIYDGSVYQFVHVETAVASVAQTKAAINGAAFENLGATWLRSSLGQLDWFTYVGGIRGAVPDVVNTSLGHEYCRFVIDEDLTADLADIWGAFNDVLLDDLTNMPAAIAAMKTAIETAVTDPGPDGNIIYAEEYIEGSVATHGDTAIKVGVTYTPAGVTP